MQSTQVLIYLSKSRSSNNTESDVNSSSLNCTKVSNVSDGVSDSNNSIFINPNSPSEFIEIGNQNGTEEVFEVLEADSELKTSKSFSSTNSSLYSFLRTPFDDRIKDDENSNLNVMELRKLFSNILEHLDSLQNQIDDEKLKSDIMKTEFETKFKKLYKTNYNLMRDLDESYDELYDQMYSLDCRIIRMEQYSRRESLVISGIPESVPQAELELTVLEILRSIGVHDVSSYEICACHRLAKKNNDRYPARTIIKFTNRKVVEFCIENRDRLLEVRPFNMNLRFLHSLCAANENILHECNRLSKYGLIDSHYIRNGSIKIIKKGNFKPYKITHEEVLYKLFKDFYDHEDLYMD